MNTTKSRGDQGNFKLTIQPATLDNSVQESFKKTPHQLNISNNQLNESNMSSGQKSILKSFGRASTIKPNLNLMVRKTTVLRTSILEKDMEDNAKRRQSVTHKDNVSASQNYKNLDFKQLMQQIESKKNQIKNRNQKKSSIEQLTGNTSHLKLGGNREKSSSSDDNKNNNNKKQPTNKDPIQRRKSIFVKGEANHKDFIKGYGLMDIYQNRSKDKDAKKPPMGYDKVIQVRDFFNEANKSEDRKMQQSPPEKRITQGGGGSPIRYGYQQNGRVDTFEESEFTTSSNEEEQRLDSNLISQRQNLDMIDGAQIPNENQSFQGTQKLDGQSINITVLTGNQQRNNQSQDDDEDNDRSKLQNFSLLDDQISKKVLPRLIINPTSLWKTIWNVFVLMLILFLAVTVPFRIPFEDNTSLDWTIVDIIIDFLFLIDVGFNFFTAFDDENGELVTNKQKIVRNYLKSWFLVDLVSSVPISLISYLIGNESVSNIKFIKLSRLPRLYRLLRLVKLMRLYKSNKFIEKLFSQINISMTAHRMIQSLIMMIFLLHLIGCLWATVATLTQGDYILTWMDVADVTDQSSIDQYIASVYWAAVTIYTVGYGDITPHNEIEIMSCVLILFTGVTLYAYMFSKLSTLFSSVNQNDNNSKTRDIIISELALKHRFSTDLTHRIQFFFQQNSNLIFISKEYAIDELLQILPAHLKSEISYFLYRDAIEVIKLLQDRDQRFYADYMSKFEPMRIKNGTTFAKEGTSPQEVFFLLKGCVLSEKQNKYFLEGTMFGETDVMMRRNRKESYISKSDCYILKLDASVFKQIYEEFEDFREDVQEIVAEREKRRIDELQEKRFKKEDPKVELQRLMSKIQHHDKKSTDGLQKSSTLSFGGVKGFSPQNHLDKPQQQEQRESTGSAGRNSSAGLKDKMESQGRISSSHKELLSVKVNPEKLLPPSFGISNNNHLYQESPDFNYNRLQKGMINRDQQDNKQAPNNRLSLHLSNIEHIKSSMRASQSKENMGVIEERIQETKNQIRMEKVLKDVDINKRDDLILDDDTLLKHEYDRFGITNDQKPNLSSLQVDLLNKPLHQKHKPTQDQQPYPLEMGSDSGRQTSRQVADSFNMKLSQSLMKLKQLQEEEEVKRQVTQREHPVEGGNNQQQIQQEQNIVQTNLQTSDNNNLQDPQPRVSDPSKHLSFSNKSEEDLISLNAPTNNNNHLVNSTQLQQMIESVPYNPNNDPLLENDVSLLASHIESCLVSINNTRQLIKEYCQLFKVSIESMGEDANEIIKKHYQQGDKCLNSYLTIMALIEKLITSIDLRHISEKVNSMQIKTNESEKRFYFLENRVKMVQDILSRKIKMMERQRARLLSKKPLLIVKRNPLLDPRDDRHTRVNQKLIGNSPMNM